MPRAKKNAQTWEQGFKAAINASRQYWGVSEHSGKVRLRVQFPKGQGLPESDRVTLPYRWEPDSMDPVLQLVGLVYTAVMRGKRLRDAVNETIAKSDSKQKDPENWELIVERFHEELTHRGNQIKEQTYRASYGRYFDVALELLKGANKPSTGSELVKAVLDHPRKNRKSGKVHGTPLAPWRQQPSSRLECCLALKRMLEFAVEDCHQPQRWLIGTTEYMRLRGAPPNRADRAALSDAECLQLFEELDKKVNRGWGDVARIFRVYGIRMWEMNFLAVRPNWKNEPQLYVTKGKTFTKKGIKRETNPRFLEPLPVVNETFGLLEKISSGALVLPTGKDGNTMAISGANFGKNLRSIPLWRDLVKVKAAQGTELKPYCFRHTYSAQCTALGIHTDNASAAMGHSAEVHRRIYRTSTQSSVTNDFERARAAAPRP